MSPHARGLRWVLIGALLASAAAYALLTRGKHAMVLVRRSASAVPVVAITAERRSLPVVVEGIGTVKAYNTVTLEPLIAGRIAQIDFVEGQSVRPGEVLARLDPRLLEAELGQARAARLRDEAKLRYARENLKRLESIAAQGFVSRDLVDSQQAQVATLQATVVADRAAERNASVQLSYTKIRAPIAGLTGIRMVDEGNVIAPSGPGIVVITQIKPIAVIFTLPASALASLPDGRSPRGLPVSAYDAADRTRLASGTLALVDNQIDPRTNTARLKAIFPNSRGTLRPGEFVNVHLREALARNALVVPERAIQDGRNGRFVWLLRSDSTVEARRVKIGVIAGSWVQIVGGLATGDKIVLEGTYGLHAGARVQVQARSAVAPSARGLLEIP